MKWFNKQSRLVQILLLLIPFVNWVTELVVRWTAVWQGKKSEKTLHLVVAIVVTIFGMPFGWIDLIWSLLFKHLILA